VTGSGKQKNMSTRSLSRMENISALIRTIRGTKVILDADLAKIYGVPTKALNQAVKRNLGRFPDDFMFQLTAKETANLNRSQIVTGSQKHRDPRLLPYAFTEKGAVMAANILNSPDAVRMSIFVVRAFIKMRELLGTAGRRPVLRIPNGIPSLSPGLARS